jgi:hypothetical protein
MIEGCRFDDGPACREEQGRRQDFEFVSYLISSLVSYLPCPPAEPPPWEAPPPPPPPPEKPPPPLEDAPPPEKPPLDAPLL